MALAVVSFCRRERLLRTSALIQAQHRNSLPHITATSDVFSNLARSVLGAPGACDPFNHSTSHRVQVCAQLRSGKALGCPPDYWPGHVRQRHAFRHRSNAAALKKEGHFKSMDERQSETEFWTLTVDLRMHL